jgi:hypothetical protein
MLWVLRWGGEKVLSVDADRHVGPARHIRRAREHAGRLIDPEPCGPFGKRESGLLDVEVASAATQEFVLDVAAGGSRLSKGK